MVSRRLKPVCPPQTDLSFPPPFQDQAKYLALADQFLAEAVNGKNNHDRLKPTDVEVNRTAPNSKRKRAA